jgi:hypothetical protein
MRGGFGVKVIQDRVFVVVINALIPLSERSFVRFMTTSPPSVLVYYHMFIYTAFNVF